MNHTRRWLLTWLIVMGCANFGFTQKVKVGYDKNANFSRYKTYTWAKLEAQPERPLLYEAVVGRIDYELKAKGLERTEQNGDLTLVAAGGIDFGSSTFAGTPILPVYGGPPPSMDATMWTGADGSAATMGAIMAQGSLVLQFIDRGGNKVIWSGTVLQKLDNDQKKKSLDLVDKAIIKLLKEYPPKSSSK
jgi:Domain of unknown function (DUF4136)